MKKIVVLGGSGFVGRYIVAELAARCDTVVVPTRRRERARHLLLLPTVDVVNADVHDERRLADLFSGADCVINMVGILHGDFQRVHVELARKVVTACGAAGVERLLHMSALNAGIQAPSSYLRTKGEAERLVMDSSLAWTIFRPSVIFGREDRLLNLFAQLSSVLPVIMLGGAASRFQPVFVGDVSRAFVHCVDDDVTTGERYPLCGPKVYTLSELVRYAGELAGYRRPVHALSPGLASLQAAILERLPGALMTRDNLASMQVDSVCDCPFPPAFGFAPTSMETVAPGYLGPAARRDRLAEYRAALRRE